MKTKTIPFDLETAKKIQAGDIAGKIKTKTNKDVRVICWDRMDTDTPIVFLVQYDNWEDLHECDSMGKYTEGYGDDARLNKLVLEVLDNEPQFKPFDKVLVRDDDLTSWQAAFFSHIKSFEDGERFAITTSGDNYNLANNEIIPYEGHEHLVGTTDKSKED